MELLGTLLFGLIAWAVLAAVTAPLESLGWWAGWYGEEAEGDEAAGSAVAGSAVAGSAVAGSAVAGSAGAKPTADESETAQAAQYVVFLTGIAGVEQENHMPEERLFLARLGEQLPNAVIVGDIFPYSVTNRALTGQRAFSWFWRFALRRKEQGGRMGFLINIRNIFQVLVSADERYGPMYNQGSANLVLQGLKSHGYVMGSDAPVYLLGYSGGGQISIGAARYLTEKLRGPVTVISLGGVLCADPGLLEVNHHYQITAEKDSVERLGVRIFPGRWPMMKNSYWNRGLAEGKITIVDMGPMTHNGADGYLDDESQLDETHSNLDATVETISGLIKA